MSTTDFDRVLQTAMADDSLEIPPPPQVAREVQRLTRAEISEHESADVTTSELAKLIQRDVALAAQVMRVANSALYARRVPVVTLTQAIAWLGMREIRTIAYSVAVQGQLFASTYFRREMTELWRESVITALFAQEIARLKGRDMESAYLCGLLHRAGLAVILARVGNAALMHCLNPDPSQVVQHAAGHEARAGSQLTLAWQLPPAVGAAIAHWRQPLKATEARIEVMEVALARQVSDELRTPGAGGELPDSMLGPISRCMEELKIYPGELFSLMANRAAIYATAESYV